MNISRDVEDAVPYNQMMLIPQSVGNGSKPFRTNERMSLNYAGQPQNLMNISRDDPFNQTLLMPQSVGDGVLDVPNNRTGVI